MYARARARKALHPKTLCLCIDRKVFSYVLSLLYYYYVYYYITIIIYYHYYYYYIIVTFIVWSWENVVIVAQIRR